MLGGVPLEDYLASLGISAPVLSAPAPPDTPPTRPPASFSSLPPELKAKIAAHVRELDQEEDEDEAEATYASAVPDPHSVVRKLEGMLGQGGDRTQAELAKMMAEMWAMALPCRTGLAAFSLVERDCYLAARPLLWKYVDTTNRTCQSLLTFVSDILPRHHLLITALDWDVRSNIDRDDLEEGFDLTDDEKRIVEEVEAVVADQLVGDHKEVEEIEARRLRMPNLLIAKIIKACPNLEAVDFSAFERRLFNDGTSWEGLLGDDPFVAILAGSFNLRSIVYDLDWDANDGREGGLQRLIESSPNLKELDISTAMFEHEDVETSPAGYRELFEAIAALKHLELLTLGIPLPSTFEDLAFQSPVERLELSASGPTSPSAMHTFLGCFSSTLVELEWRYPDIPLIADYLLRTPPPIRPFPLPNLTHLIIASTYEEDPSAASAYSYFAQSPIDILHIGDCTSSTIPHILFFLDAHRSTLKRVEHLTVYDYGDDFDEGDLETLEERCEQYGIEFVEVEDETETDDEDEEDDDEGDDEGYYNNYGYPLNYGEDWTDTEPHDEDGSGEEGEEEEDGEDEEEMEGEWEDEEDGEEEGSEEHGEHEQD